MKPLEELEALKRRQDWLESEVGKCREHLGRVEESLRTSLHTKSFEPTPELRPTQLEAVAEPPAPVPPLFEPVPITLETALSSDAVPPVIQEAQPAILAQEELVEPPFATTESLPQESEPAFDAATPPPVMAQDSNLNASRIPPRATPSDTEGSFEMRLGTYWLVRIGIVMFLTGLAFFGNYAYQKFIVNMGPGGKLCLLYTASALLLTGGAWWQRKAAKESLRNYGQVLFAGGLAAVYFTTYAAHHIPLLRVIENPVLDGVLLLGWTGFMVWIADRRKSEVLAFFALGLAYYTSIITRVGYFTLYSNLLLTVAAVFFLVRHRWATLTFASVAATYGGYAFWRFFNGTEWHWASPEQGLWTGTWFLLSYWVVFTAAVFLSRAEKFRDETRAGFATMNNGLFFGLFILTMLQVQSGRFWEFCLIYGTGLLALAAASRVRFPDEPAPTNSYLTQGLVIFTLGLILKFSGMQLALILGAESVVLLMLGWQRQNLILRAGGYLAALLSTGWGIDGMGRPDPAGAYTGAGLGLFMLANCWEEHRKTPSDNFRGGPAYFGALAITAWLTALWNNAAAQDLPLLVLCLGAVLTFSVYALRIKELTLLAQLCVLLGNLLPLMLTQWQTPPWWNLVSMAGLNLALVHWWQRQRITLVEPPLPTVLEALYSIAAMAWIYQWLYPHWPGKEWLCAGAVVAVSLTLYGALTRSVWVAASAQLFTLAGMLQFTWHLGSDRPEWGYPLVPIATLLVLAAGGQVWLRLRPQVRPERAALLRQIAAVYRWLAIGMSIWWVCQYVPDQHRIWLFGLISLCLFAMAGHFRNRETAIASAAYLLPGLIIYWIPGYEPRPTFIADFMIILAVIAEQRVARRAPHRFGFPEQAHSTYVIVGGLTLWLFLSRNVLQHASGFYLTACWSALALVLFGFGLLVRERMYRWLGLGVLACALGRVVLFDVWKLDTVFRILSFMALGIALLILGFIYNKYQEKFKEWL